MSDPIDVEEGEWTHAEVEVYNGHVSLAIDDESQLIMTPKMARKLAKRLKQCADQCAVTVAGEGN